MNSENKTVSLNIDYLTGLASEYGFFEKTREILDHEGANYSIASVDIDNFKYINELYGYDTGTEVIIEVAKHLVKEFIHAKVVARVYADHFLMLLPKIKEETQIAVCGKERCIQCRRHILDDILGESYNLDMSVGIYNINDTSLSLNYMIDCANYARAKGKDIYGHTYTMFTKERENSLKQKNAIVQTMIQGIEQKEFKMLYQPKVNLNTGKIAGAEALVRWIKPDGTQICPDDFIPLFEKNGFIVRLDYYVFEQVCKFISGHKNLPKISVNLSSVTLVNRELILKLTEIMEENQVEAKQIELEITESAIVENFEQAVLKILSLKELGFTIAMDDFGAGVSSLNRLNEIYVDVLKLDKQFLKKSLIGERGAIIVQHIIHLAKQLQVGLVVEGVETKEHIEFLQELGCDVAQGYYYAKPLTEIAFLEQIELRNHIC